MKENMQKESTMKEKLQKIRENAIAQIENSERGCTGGSPEGGTVGK